MTPEKRADILEKYGWQPGEREAAQRDLAERQRRIAHDAAVAWAQARNAERAEAERAQAEEQPTVTKSEAAMTGSMTDEWARYIKQQIDTRQRPLEGAIADLLAIERKAMRDAVAAERDERQKAETEIAVLRQELAAVRREVSELRGEAKVRGAIDDVQARLAKLETPPRLKAMG